MTGALWRSAFVAGVFALHPLHVESVEWVCERKDVMNTFFGLLSLIAYARYAGRGEMEQGRKGAEGKCSEGTSSPIPIFYWLSLLFFACSLMSKPMLVTLPFVLLLLDYWPLCRLSFNPTSNIQHPKLSIQFLVLEKVPFLALTVADSIATFLAQKAGGAIVSADTLPIGRRLANALMAYFHYLRDTFWPANLSACYPPSEHWLVWQPLLAAVILICLTVLILRQRRSYLLMGWLWFLGTLVPVIGLVQTGAQTIADRFMYFPLIGLTICFTWGAFDLLRRWPMHKPFLVFGSVALLALCAYTTRRQVSFWKDDFTVFTRALAVTQNNFVAHNLYAIALQKHGRYDEAFEHLKESVRINPRNPDPYVGMAVYRGNQGDIRSAKEYAATALQLSSNNPEAHDAFGVALLLQGSAAEAETYFAQAVKLRASFAIARMHWAVSLREQGKLDEAITQLREALRYQPDSTEIQEQMNATLIKKGGAGKIPGRSP